MFSTCLKNLVSWNHHLVPQRMHPQKHIPYYFLKKSKVTVRKNETGHSHKHFQYIKIIYLETWFNFLHLILFSQSKIFSVSISKNTINLRNAWFSSFLLHLTCQKWPSLACTHPFDWRKGTITLVFYFNRYGRKCLTALKIAKSCLSTSW